MWNENKVYTAFVNFILVMKEIFDKNELTWFKSTCFQSYILNIIQSAWEDTDFTSHLHETKY